MKIYICGKCGKYYYGKRRVYDGSGSWEPQDIKDLIDKCIDGKGHDWEERFYWDTVNDKGSVKLDPTYDYST